MEENKTLIVIVAVVAIVAIFSLAFTGRVTSIEKSATQNLVGEAIRNNIEPNCACTLGAATLGPGSTGIPMEKYRIRLPEVGH